MKRRHSQSNLGAQRDTKPDAQHDTISVRDDMVNILQSLTVSRNQAHANLKMAQARAQSADQAIHDYALQCMSVLGISRDTYILNLDIPAFVKKTAGQP